MTSDLALAPRTTPLLPPPPPSSHPTHPPKTIPESMSVAIGAATAAPGLHFVPYPVPLVRGTFLRRRDRFIADVQLDTQPAGTTTEAHCVNPGRMEAFIRPGSEVWLLPATPGAKSKRKLDYTWELLDLHHHRHDDEKSTDGSPTPCMCGTNTMRPNTIVNSMLGSRRFPGLEDWQEMQPERTVPASIHHKATALKRIGASSDKTKSSRLDFWLRDGQGRDQWIEVKNSHMVVDGYSYFPDSVSDRASRHLETVSI